MLKLGTPVILNDVRRIFATCLAIIFLMSLMASRADAESAPGLPAAQWTVAKKPSVVVITIHGGSWFQNADFYAYTQKFSQMYSSRANAAAMNIEYTSGVNSLPDVIKSYDIAHKKYPSLPICAYGWSAGGNLALLLANHRKLACVISEAGPTDIATGSDSIKHSADFFFGGSANYNAWSPVYTTKKIKQPTLLVSATNDNLVLHSQAVEFKQKFPRSKLITLRPGQTDFIHSKVNTSQLNAARTYEVKLVKSVALKRN